jgi:hypothetical protein
MFCFYRSFNGFFPRACEIKCTCMFSFLLLCKKINMLTRRTEQLYVNCEFSHRHTPPTSNRCKKIIVSLLLSKFSISKWDRNKSSIISSCVFLCEWWMNTALQQFFQGYWLNDVQWANLLLFKREKSLRESARTSRVHIWNSLFKIQFYSGTIKARTLIIYRRQFPYMVIYSSNNHGHFRSYVHT